MNIAFEISPLLLASGTFGDKSGVYRYYYGLIKALGLYIKKNKINIKIFLFSFNKDLLSSTLNKEILNLLDNDVFSFINKVPESKKDNLLILKFLDPIFKPFLKIINIIIPIKKIFFELSNRLKFLHYIKFLTTYFKKNKIKIIYHSETCFFPLNGFNNVITIYDLTPIITPHFHRTETIDLTQRKLNITRKKCQGIVCISQSTKKDLLDLLPDCANKKIIVCYPGLDPVFTNKVNKSLFKDIQTLSQHQVNNLKSKKYLFFYSTFEPRKNIINLIQSFIELKQENKIPKDFKLILLGGDGWGKIKKTAINYIKENFIIKEKNSIILFDYLNDQYLITLIKNAYAVVYPTFYEGFGLPVLETMALSVPVITSQVSSLPEVGGNSALYIDPYNFNDLKNKMELIIKKPKLAKKLSISGFKQSKKFNWNNSASELFKFFKQLSNS